MGLKYAPELFSKGSLAKRKMDSLDEERHANAKKTKV